MAIQMQLKDLIYRFSIRLYLLFAYFAILLKNLSKIAIDKNMIFLVTYGIKVLNLKIISR